ncbi:hypothetical protein SAMN05216436_1433 [bacterium A37T11]|nr:hypothetical protein SAMN05216436_1433 [bacterium A37T11]
MLGTISGRVNTVTYDRLGNNTSTFTSIIQIYE